MIKVNKRIPLSFFINVLLQTVAMISRALNELIFDNESSKIPLGLIGASKEQMQKINDPEAEHVKSLDDFYGNIISSDT
jgi:hypothetical protein